MATGLNTCPKSIVKSIRSYRQKLHFFKWKLWKYQEAGDVYFMERNNAMVMLCEKNSVAYQKALIAAQNRLSDYEEEYKTLCQQS